MLDYKHQIIKITKAQKILKILKQKKIEAFIVGGAVRDWILKLPIRDVDITTNAHPSVIRKIFSSEFISMDNRYGCVKIFFQNHYFDITTYRKEKNYFDYRHPSDIEFVSDVKEDIMRRDFTINALLLDNNNNIFDYVNGIFDLKNRLIRTIGNIHNKLTEDPLRMMRIFYFQAKLNFEIEEETFSILKKNIFLLQKIKNQMLLKEFSKILQQKNIQKAFSSLQETKAFDFVKSLKKGIIFVLRNNLQDVSEELFFSLSFILDPQIIHDFPFATRFKKLLKKIFCWHQQQKSNDLLCYNDEYFQMLKEQIQKIMQNECVK
ncbi:CCA tRNA nucleotidyltransferase [Candidatus Phytoplasma melaleucae]|uniref:CCA tRNA nucleotidyltransferase n=1 Tax=Candidatus Phytoplasma melaleucae TaxID=2982630 RepID=A0ABT9DF94_9MOLU|nr:CCA tRNA nucleotidyltransferase ['Melaleuca sp.' phytoplasma]MDO8167891.1 CCA tRNA nucleotidyltransferase ['Melaleuca sp.' phytoplasma]